MHKMALAKDTEASKFPLQRSKNSIIDLSDENSNDNTEIDIDILKLNLGQIEELDGEKALMVIIKLSGFEISDNNSDVLKQQIGEAIKNLEDFYKEGELAGRRQSSLIAELIDKTTQYEDENIMKLFDYILPHIRSGKLKTFELALQQANRIARMYILMKKESLH